VRRAIELNLARGIEPETRRLTSKAMGADSGSGAQASHPSDSANVDDLSRLVCDATAVVLVRRVSS
jgi:hypothetical protein